MERPPAGSPPSPPPRRPPPPRSQTLPPEIFNRFAGSRFWVQLSGYVSLGSAVVALAIGFATLFKGAGDMTSTIFLFQISLACVYGALAIYLLRYGHAIKAAALNRNATTLTEAMRMQLRYWQFIGAVSTALITLCIALGVMVLLIPLVKKMIP